MLILRILFGVEACFFGWCVGGEEDHVNSLLERYRLRSLKMLTNWLELVLVGEESWEVCGCV